jgi:hypothetical protein
MAGDIFSKERAIVTLTTAGSSLTNNSGGVANATSDLDCRNGSSVTPQDFEAIFEFIGQWSTVTGITNGTVVAELYLIPALDGTNFPDVDTTSGASNFPPATLVGLFTACKAPSSSTDMRFVSNPVNLQPLLYRPYIKNKSGQTLAANWTVKAVSVRTQYS